MFRDSKNDQWTIEIDVPACKRVRQLTSVDLLSTDSKALLLRLADTITLVDVIYAVCKPQADERGLSDEDFGRRMGIDLEPVAEELLNSLADFIQSLGRKTQARMLRTILKRALQTTTQVRERLDLEVLDRKIETAFDQFDAGIDQELTGLMSTESPESSDSTQSSPV